MKQQLLRTRRRVIVRRVINYVRAGTSCWSPKSGVGRVGVKGIVCGDCHSLASVETHNRSWQNLQGYLLPFKVAQRNEEE